MSIMRLGANHEQEGRDTCGLPIGKPQNYFAPALLL